MSIKAGDVMKEYGMQPTMHWRVEDRHAAVIENVWRYTPHGDGRPKNANKANVERWRR